MSDILVIGEQEIVEGFSLTGADVEECADPDRIQWKVSELMRTRSHGIVIITESLYATLQEKLRLKAEQSARPLFVTLPRPAGHEVWGEREDLISSIIRRAIGYRLRIKR